MWAGVENYFGTLKKTWISFIMRVIFVNLHPT